MSVESAQQYHTNQVHYLRKDFTFSDAGSTLSMGWLPAGAVIMGGGIVVSTVFNSGTSDVGDLGYRNSAESGTSDDVDEWMTDADLTAAGFITADEIDASVAELYFPNGAEAVVSYASTGTAPTTGAAHAYVMYIVDNT
jgi:hypothetical protein